jgi:hypothetical protein
VISLRRRLERLGKDDIKQTGSLNVWNATAVSSRDRNDEDWIVDADGNGFSPWSIKVVVLFKNSENGGM